MSRSSKKSGGLNFNPLLSRTGSAAETAALVDNDDARSPADASMGGAGPPTDRAPTKFTFYYTPAQLERLDVAWSAFRRRIRGSGRPLSKSLFVRVALDRLLDDFDRDPDAVMTLLREHGATTLDDERPAR